ncbi:Ribose methyltransferase [Kappamyces sp. JEL0829]|nr:Ribose methyltransferase [Kappamyces sp. JEL0829]
MFVRRFSTKGKVEYLFGAGPVLSALQAKTRRLVKLLVKTEETGYRARTTLGPIHHSGYVRTCIELAERASVPVAPATKSELDRFSLGRPNQGLCLAVGSLATPAINHMGPYDTDGAGYDVVQSTGEALWVPFASKHLYPLWLVLDRIVDPQNIGAILRTAFFYGVDGIVLSTKESCPITPTVAKASAGATEKLSRIFTVRQLSRFVQESIRNGWIVLGTDLSSDNTTVVGATEEPLLCGPTLLVVGNEGDGIRRSVSELCHTNLIIASSQMAGGQDEAYLVESLNVSVATGILLQKLTESGVHF